MRNLKKVLSLALAMVMLLGMMVVGAGATSFTDDADITHQEAVTVVSGMEILTGVGDNTFNPKGTLSRAEAAVVIAKLDLGAAFGNLATTNASTFKDVGAGYGWAKPYIDYCAARGLIAGDGNGYFMPGDKVTGVQFALMVARVLGYEDANESIGGANWEVNAAALARKAGLTIDVTLGSTPIPRDDMAQVAFNALQADMVEYKQSAITIGDITIPAGKASPRDEGNVNYNGDSKQTLQLCEEKFPNLKKDSTKTDNFGRPDTVWSYNKEDLFSKPDTATVTYTDSVKQNAVYKDLKNYEVKDKGTSGITPKEDGVPAAAVKNITEAGSTDDLAKYIADQSGKGVTITVYTNSDREVTEVAVINPYIGKVTKVVTKDGETTTTISRLNGGPTAATTFATSAFQKDDYVLYNVGYDSKSVIETMTLAEKVSDQTITSFTGAAGTATKLVSDSTYDRAANGVHKDDIAINSSYDLYLDSYGYVIYSELYAAGSSDYAYVLDAAQSGTFTDKTNMVQLLLADGTIVEGKSDKNYASSPNLKQHVVTYRLNKNEEYELTDKGAGQSGTVSTVMEPNKSTITAGGKTINANSSTVFVVGTNDGTGGKYTYTVYTGIANAPKINANVAAIAADNSSVAKYVFIQAASNNVTSESDKTIFVKGASKDPTKAITVDGISYYEYDAMIDGEKTTLKVKTGATIVSTLAANTWLKQTTVDKDGYITAATAYTPYNTASPSTAGVVGPTTGTDRSGDAVRMGYAAGAWYTLKEDAPVVLVDGDDIGTGSVTDVEKSDADSVIAVAKDGQIIALAVVRDGRSAVTGAVTEGTVMDKITEDDVADRPVFAGVTQYVVEGLTATTASDGTITISGDIPVAKQFTKTSGHVTGSFPTDAVVPGFSTLQSDLDAATNSSKAAIIPIQAADGGIILYLIGNHNATQSMITPINIVKDEYGVKCNLSVKFDLNWLTP